MPMGNVKGGTNCQVCIDCEPMRSPTDTCYRCYGQGPSTPLKRDFSVNEPMPPAVAPNWCPNRKKLKRNNKEVKI